MSRARLRTIAPGYSVSLVDSLRQMSRMAGFRINYTSCRSTKIYHGDRSTMLVTSDKLGGFYHPLKTRGLAQRADGPGQ